MNKAIGMTEWRKPRQSPVGVLGSTLLLLFILFFVLYPLLLLLYGSFLSPEPGGEFSFSWGAWVDTWTRQGTLQAIYNTFLRTIVTEIIALPAAIGVAWLVARTDIPCKRMIDMFFWLAMFFPALPVLLGWIFLFDPDRGLANVVLMRLFSLDAPPFNIYSFSGIVFAHLASRSIAAKYIFLAPAFRNVDSAMEEAAHVAGDSPFGGLRRIVLPLLMPAILVTMAVSLTHSIEAFEIELILGAPINFYVFSTKMYQFIHQDPPLYASATVLGLATLVLMLPFIIWQQRVSLSGRFASVTSKFQERPLALRSMRWPAFISIALLGFFITILPAVCLVAGTFMTLFGNFDLPKIWTVRHWVEVWNDQTLMSALLNTLTLSVSAALIGTSIFSLVAYVSVRTQFYGRRVLDIATWVPSMLPGVILSLGFLWMFLTVPVVQMLYGTMLVLVVAVVVNFMTSGVQLIKSNVLQLSYDFEEASYISGASWTQTFRRIVLPLLGPGLLSVALLMFNSAARNVSNIVMLVTRDTTPLSILQISFMVDGQYEPAAIIGLITVVLSLTAAVSARWIARRFGFRSV